MYSRPAPTSIGTICPGSFVAKEIPPGAPMARYSVMNSDPPRHALQHAEDSSPPTKLGVRRHLDGTRHPRKFTGFRNDGLVGVKREFKYRHGGAEDATLHGRLLVWIARCRRALSPRSA